MASSSYHSEAQRRANDLLRVHNPTDKDYVIDWDRKNGVKQFRVPAGSDTVLIRYIAEKYIREMYQKIVTSKTDQAIRDKNQERIKKGMAEMDKTLKTGEQMQYEMQVLNEATQKQKEIIASLYVGIENEYGLDRKAQDEAEEKKEQSFDSALEAVQREKSSNDAHRTAAVLSDQEPDEFHCDQCDFTTKYKIALAGHKKSHENKMENIANT